MFGIFEYLACRLNFANFVKIPVSSLFTPTVELSELFIFKIRFVYFFVLETCLAFQRNYGLRNQRIVENISKKVLECYINPIFPVDFWHCYVNCFSRRPLHPFDSDTPVTHGCSEFCKLPNKCKRVQDMEDRFELLKKHHCI